jgi:hypothetical protein
MRKQLTQCCGREGAALASNTHTIIRCICHRELTQTVATSHNHLLPSRERQPHPHQHLECYEMHHFLALFWFFYFHYLLGSLIGAFFFLAAFALFGIETGLHRKYVSILLATFEVCDFSSFLFLLSNHTH